MEVKIDQEEIMKLLDKLYDQAVGGISRVSPSVGEQADENLKKRKEINSAAKKFINYQKEKCANS